MPGKPLGLSRIALDCRLKRSSCNDPDIDGDDDDDDNDERRWSA